MKWQVKETVSLIKSSFTCLIIIWAQKEICISTPKHGQAIDKG